MKNYLFVLIFSTFLIYLNLTPFVRIYRGYIAFIVSPASSLILSLNTEVGGFTIALSKFLTYKRKNEKLLQTIEDKNSEIAILKQKINELEYISEQGSHIKDSTFILANIVGIKYIKGSMVFVIDKGLSSGLTSKSTVVYKNYLVGRVVELDNNRALVKTIDSADIQIPAESIDNSTLGTYSCENYNCYFSKVLNSSPLSINELIITSGVSGEYKRGFIIGRVAKIDSSPEELFKKAKLSIELNLSSISKVSVIINEN